MHALPAIWGYLLLMGLAFFFGLAYEDFYAHDRQVRPGGVRTFPLLALCGGILYQLDPDRLIPLTGGLIAVAAWLTAFYAWHIRQHDEAGEANVGMIGPVSNLLAYLLGPAALALPPWVAVGATVAGVMLLTQRARLHAWARTLDMGEIITAGKFLILTGFVLPLLPDTPVTTLTSITPHQVWLAVIAVSTVSYASYLLQRYAIPHRATVLVGFLGGLYSSTVTTVVLARRVRAVPEEAQQANTGMMLATAVMYLRLLAVVAILNFALAMRVAPFAAGLAALGFCAAGVWHTIGARRASQGVTSEPPPNPLDIRAALTFAVAFVAISLLVAWVRGRFGSAGLYTLAAVVGVTDIDPFVLNMAQSTPADVTARMAAGAILIATASNNVLKAAYAGFLGGRGSLPSVIALLALAAVSAALVLWSAAL